MSEPLADYLHDHLAGSNFAIELLENLNKQHAGEPVGEFAADELNLLLEDRAILQRIIDRVGAGTSSLKEAVAWVSEKASRLKLKHPESKDFEIFEALELLAVGIHGRVGLWRVLSVVAPSDSRVPTEDYDALALRAQQQHDRVEQRRLQSAPSALRPAK